MIHYSFIYPETGIIDQSGYCPDASCLPELPEGCVFKLGFVGNPEAERFDGDDLIPYCPDKTQEELAFLVALERGRRLSSGFDYDFGDTRGVHHVGTTEADMAGWREVSDMAFKAIARDDVSKEIMIATDTGPAVVTAAEWLDVLDAAEAFRQPIWTASFILQSLSPIPQDVTADALWP
jgi:hypothetical protein